MKPHGMSDREKALWDALEQLTRVAHTLAEDVSKTLPASGQGRATVEAQRRDHGLAVRRSIHAANAVLAGNQCSHCKAFVLSVDGAIQTHDFPPPCRSVCPGSGRPPLGEENPPEESPSAPAAPASAATPSGDARRFPEERCSVCKMVLRPLDRTFGGKMMVEVHDRDTDCITALGAAVLALQENGMPADAVFEEGG